MQSKRNYVIPGVTSLFCVVIFGVAWIARDPWLVAGGALGLHYVLLRAAYASRVLPRQPARAADPMPPLKPDAAVATPPEQGGSDCLVEKMLAQGRYALLLRPKIAGNLGEVQFRRAREAHEKDMALVPDGEVVLGRIERLQDDATDEEATAAGEGRVIRVERFFLDRYPVTNRQFREFVADGGYQQMALWDESIWPAVLDLVDRTGMPGPRYWENGRFPPGEEEHPVVGVSWHEASAYARWAGKRLPTDAEWVKAGSWPVALSSTARIQRRYPWGDTMDRNRANLWNPRSVGTVPVAEYANGVSVGGVYQLIGNVWEWTSGNFRVSDHVSGRLELPSPMKSIRGGAFDTYFDNHASCQFQSGENPLGRRRNIGFRCAVGVCDLVLARPETAQQQPADDDPAEEEAAPVAEEVWA